MVGETKEGARANGGHSLFSDDEWEWISRSLRLSPREREVAMGVFDDEVETAIAIRLGISPHTVHTHLERIYRKLGVKSRGELLVRIFGQYLSFLRHGAEPSVPSGDSRGHRSCARQPSVKEAAAR